MPSDRPVPQRPACRRGKRAGRRPPAPPPRRPAARRRAPAPARRRRAGVGERDGGDVAVVALVEADAHRADRAGVADPARARGAASGRRGSRRRNSRPAPTGWRPRRLASAPSSISILRSEAPSVDRQHLVLDAEIVDASSGLLDQRDVLRRDRDGERARARSARRWRARSAPDRHRGARRPPPRRRRGRAPPRAPSARPPLASSSAVSS